MTVKSDVVAGQICQVIVRYSFADEKNEGGGGFSLFSYFSKGNS